MSRQRFDIVATLIRELGLRAHPEGGHFAEVFRSSARVLTGDGRGDRSAITNIYYLLAAGDISRWHRVTSDEVWHFYEGAPLDLLVLGANGEQLDRHVVGEVGDGHRPTVTVAAGQWQAAQTTGDYSLVGCTVGPGFDFADFSLARDVPSMSDLIRSRHAATVRFL